MRYALVPDSMVTEAARRSGGRLLTDQDYAAVAKTLNVQAFVSATVRRQQDWRIEMVVRKGDTGQAVARYDWSGRRIDALAASVARADPEAAARRCWRANPTCSRARLDETVQAHADASREPRRRGEPPPSAPGARERPFLEVSVGSRVFSRSMSFAQNVNGLPGYRLGAGTGIDRRDGVAPVRAPAARQRTAGRRGSGSMAPSTWRLASAPRSMPPASSARPTPTATRPACATGSPPAPSTCSPRVSYLVDNFVASGDLSPNVHYQVLRAGLGARAALSSRLSLRASLDYLDVLSAGALTSTTFPRASANGLDVTAGVGYGIGRTFELQMSAAMRRYGFDMRSQAGDAFVAGGASDQYLSMAFGIAYRPSLERH